MRTRSLISSPASYDQQQTARVTVHVADLDTRLIEPATYFVYTHTMRSWPAAAGAGATSS